MGFPKLGASAKLFFFNDTATTEIYTLSLHDALPISEQRAEQLAQQNPGAGELLRFAAGLLKAQASLRSEEHTSELQSRLHLVCRLLLEKKKNRNPRPWAMGTPRPAATNTLRRSQT